jgi:cell division protein FtsL
MANLVYTPRVRGIASNEPIGSRRPFDEYPEFPETEPKQATKKKSPGETVEKVIKRIPTFYVIIFFTVFTACAVLIVWNTLQVNRLAYRKSSLEAKIELQEQRIIKLKAQEMRLAAPDRIRELALTKLKMTESTSEDEIIIQ